MYPILKSNSKRSMNFLQQNEAKAATEARELKMAHKSDSVKRVYVYMDEKQHMDLKIRLDYHNVGMSEFVRACSEALLLGHPIMEQFMDNYFDIIEEDHPEI